MERTFQVCSEECWKQMVLKILEILAAIPDTAVAKFLKFFHQKKYKSTETSISS